MIRESVLVGFFWISKPRASGDDPKMHDGCVLMGG